MVGKIWQIIRALPALVLLIITACDSQPAPSLDKVVMDSASVSVPLPQSLRTPSEIDPAALRATVTINGVETVLQLDPAGRFTGEIVVPTQSDINVQITFMEFFSGQLLTLGRAERSITTGTGNTVLTLLPDDYNFVAFDFDGDGASNLLERQYNTSPLDSAQLPDLFEVEVIAELPPVFLAAGFDSYQIVAAIGDKTRVVDASVGQFRESFRVVRQDNLSVNLRLIEDVTGQRLTVGEQAREIDQDSGLVIVDGTTWNLDFDQDADGQSDADELVAGTDLFSNPFSDFVPYTISFEVPAEITNIDNVFALLEVDGQAVPLSRVGNTYTGSVESEAGVSVVIEAEIRGSHLGTSVLLANFSGQTVPVENMNLQLQDFSTDHDADNDGISNITELEQGTDPFNANQCTVVSETILATLTDDAFIRNSRLVNNAGLSVDAGRRVSLLRFQYDQNVGQVTSASLNLTVGNDSGDGPITVFAVSDFQWSESADSLVVPSGTPAATLVNVWTRGATFGFSLDTALISDDVTLILRQGDGDDVVFLSGETAAPPTLELAVERCQ